MPTFFRQVWTWFVVLLWNGRALPRGDTEPEPPEPEALLPPPIAPPPTPTKPKSKPRAAPQPHELPGWGQWERKPGDPPYPTTSPGQFYFREHILDQLDDYFKIVKRMRKHDPEAYSLYSRIGAHIMPYWLPITNAETIALSPWWRVNRPAFGCVALLSTHKELAADAKDDKIYPTFFYFTKFMGGKAPRDCERFDGDVYNCTAYFHDPREPGTRKYFGAAPASFFVGVGAGGTVQILNQLLSTKVTVRSKHRHCSPHGDPQNRGSKFQLRTTRWGIPRVFDEWSGGEKHFPTPHARMRELFIVTANVYEGAQNSMIRVDAQKESMHAVFGVDVERTPYFFKDRDVTLNERGNRLRIFHIVRPHSRMRGNQESTVKLHFRGMREFQWNGYKVRITVPGRDHILIPDFDVPMREVEEKRPGDVSPGHMGLLLQRHIKGASLEQEIERARTP